MNDVRIDRLTLRLSGLDAAEGRRLAMLVSEGLAAAALPSGAVSHLGSIRLDLRADPPAGVDALAEQVVRGIVRELSRST